MKSFASPRPSAVVFRRTAVHAVGRAGTVHPRNVPLVRSGQGCAATHNGDDASAKTQESDGRCLEVFHQWPQWMHKAARVLGACAVAVALSAGTPFAAEAARSGGRIGGGGFNSSRSYSAPRSGAGMRSYGRSGSSSFGYNGYRSVPRPRSAPGGSAIIVTPSPSFGYGVPAPGYGYGYNSGYAPPLRSDSDSLTPLLLTGVALYVAYMASTTIFSRADADMDHADRLTQPVSVVKHQVALLGSARELQQDLNRLAASLDTSTSRGLHELLQETVLSLHRNPQYAVYGKTELKKARSVASAEAQFNQLSMAERGKFQRETLSNYSGRKSHHRVDSAVNGNNELIVVTVLAAVDGKLDLSDSKDGPSMRENLARLGSVPANQLLALEVLWTPQAEGDFFTRDELVTDYPTLNML